MVAGWKCRFKMRIETMSKNAYRILGLPSAPHVSKYAGTQRIGFYVDNSESNDYIEVIEFNREAGLWHVVRNNKSVGKIQTAYCGNNKEMAARCVKDSY